MRLTALWRPGEIPTVEEAAEITSSDKWTWLKGKIDVAFYDGYILNKDVEL